MTASFPVRCFILCTILTSAALAQNEYTLEYKFVNGVPYRYRSAGEMTMTMSNDGTGTSNTTETATTSITTLTLQTITPERSFVIISVIDTMLLNGKEFPGAMKDIVGKQLRMTVTPLGVVEHTEAVDPNRGASMEMAVQFGNRQFHRFSPHPVAENGTWTAHRTDTTRLSGTTIIAAKKIYYTLAGRENKNGHGCVKIAYTDSSRTFGSGTATTNGTIIMTGIIYFDLDRGIIVSEEQHMSSTMSMTMPSGVTMHNMMKGNTLQTLIE